MAQGAFLHETIHLAISLLVGSYPICVKRMTSSLIHENGREKGIHQNNVFGEKGKR